VDFAHEVEGLGRFRVNIHHHIHGLAACFRVLSLEIPTMEQLKIPASVIELVSEPSGLFLVTGPSGSGKSTTLAAMVDRINSTTRGHIITIEDPIEFVHECRQSVVTQRQVGLHAPSFAEALRNALREDPDAILVGDLRDQETVSLALTAAETGVQILASLHTLGAIRTVDRMVNAFPSSRRDQIRIMLADTLKVIVSQQLVHSVDETLRAAVFEVLINTSGAASLIRSGKSNHLSSVIQSGTRAGMQSLDSQLDALVRAGKISGEEAHLRAVDKSRFERYLSFHKAA
jgi:twitching motility protein PilT